MKKLFIFLPLIILLLLGCTAEECEVGSFGSLEGGALDCQEIFGNSTVELPIVEPTPTIKFVPQIPNEPFDEKEIINTPTAIWSFFSPIPTPTATPWR